MSLAPKEYPIMPELAGVEIYTAEAAIKTKGRKDVLLMSLPEGTNIAGTFTKSLTAAAPVDACRRNLSKGKGKARAILVNSGNANAFTGKIGADSVYACIDAVAEKLTCSKDEVFVASTGVIGQPLPHDKIINSLPSLKQSSWIDAAHAIMTTDAFPKYGSRKIKLNGNEITINAIAKGAGMIAPDMATMLCFVVTNAAIPAATMQKMLSEAVKYSFNSITVDGDTSTNDTVLMAATGEFDLDSGSLAEFAATLNNLLLELALMLARDGEGATKLVKINVHEASSEDAARKVAFSIANSPLVKTALAGSDPNWGRIVMAIGKSGEKADRDKLWIKFGDILVAENGAVSPAYTEASGAGYFKASELEISVGIGAGSATATVWTCDLGHEYVRINADYRS